MYFFIVFISFADGYVKLFIGFLFYYLILKDLSFIKIGNRVLVYPFQKEDITFLAFFLS
jgi:hypothetical protein